MRSKREDLTKYERLLLDSEMEAFQLTEDQRKIMQARIQGMTYRQISEKYYEGKRSRAALCDLYQRARQKVLAARNMEQWIGREMECPVADAPLQPRAKVALQEAGIKTLGQLAKYDEKKLKQIHGLGPSGRFQVMKLMLQVRASKGRKSGEGRASARRSEVLQATA